MKPSFKMLHTSDLHLGAKFVGLGRKGAEQRQRLREVWGEIADLAIAERVDAVLLAGDTFDSNQPSRDSLEAFLAGIRRLGEHAIPVIAIAGTHDSLEQNSVLVRMEKTAAGPLVLLTPQKPLWRSEKGQAVVQGVSLTAADAPKRPLVGLRPVAEAAWQIGMAHASLEIGRDPGKEALISPAEIAATSLDYLALGHWHGLRECTEGATLCWYAGAPEMIAMDSDKCGFILLVELEEGRPPKVEPRRVGQRTLLKLSLKVDSLEKIRDTVQKQADPHAVLELTLTGMAAMGDAPDPEALRKVLGDSFFHVRVRDNSLAADPGNLEADYPETTIAGRFIRLIQAEKAGHPEQARDLDAALRLGLALLSGREVDL